ncbi:L-seryl-tRNA(Sec) kinase-like isoform X1 [Condylostylus longicornis]|uniref:L-seryl-tRNA(Sec) kinase-like isoform X1 n=1 Tax=Condylostylus longicornis TaxID=2530218 RepID=UPI00244DF53F|nr:L-seryl-tRNA(Sec) kinase-like isoform X1 [Condylostylus longicornis]XP_055375094.1 L-seryl-tRNA(Sec) kinase-like isoform X1 [Condylostylus longicornis]
MSNIFVVVLVGLPGAGKTTFCREVFNSEFVTRAYNVIHVCFDNYIKVDKDLKSYTRKGLISEIRKLIESIKAHNFNQAILFKSSNLYRNNDKHLILIDDNNYYKGMRYEFYRICKSTSTVFVQIYFAIPLSIVLKRNQTRKDGYIPENTINNMNKKFEAPSKKSNWEKCTLIVTQEGFEIENIISYIEKCPYVKSVEVKQRTAINQNKIHETDIILRKHIKYLITNNRENKCRNIEILAEKLNLKRKNILEELRGGELDLDDNKLIDILKFNLQDFI